jgi:transposase
MAQDRQLSFSKSRKFPNSEKGFIQLHQWAVENKASEELIFTMEATGVYYENLAYWLNAQQRQVSVLLPNKVKHFTKSLNIKTKTDTVDAKAICQIGLERKPELWNPSSVYMRNIKLLAREYRENKDKLTIIKNQLHAKNHSFSYPDNIVNRLKRQISLIDAQLLEIEAELKTLTRSDKEFYDRLQLLITIPGVGFMTAISIVSETNGFALVKNAKQLASYSGLDVEHNQSGQKQGKSRISKKGNSHIRGALHMPAVCCSVHNPQFKAFYQRLIARKPAKKIAVTAVARKLLILMYTLWKNQVAYDRHYGEETKAVQATEEEKSVKEITNSSTKPEQKEKQQQPGKKKNRQEQSLPTQDGPRHKIPVKVLLQNHNKDKILTNKFAF